MNAALLLAVLAAPPSWGRAGGGCFAAGTPIETPAGPRAIESLAAGSELLSPRRGALEENAALAVHRVDAPSMVELRTDAGAVRVTPEHPFMLADGRLRLAGSLRPGERLRGFEAGAPVERELLATRRVAGGAAFNLTAGRPESFLAAGLAVHNKGCFLPETEILDADGKPRALASIRPGDRVLAFTLDGGVTAAAVREVFSVRETAYLELATDRSRVKATAEHPFFVGDGTFVPAGDLKVGQTLYLFDGKGLSQETLRSKRLVPGPVAVYNLRVDAPNTFFASGLAVHNKGGGCFPTGTPVLTPSGERPIESLDLGDEVVTHEGSAKVTGVFSTTAELLEVETDRGALLTTEEHPLALAGGGWLEAGRLAPGARLLRAEAGTFAPARVLALRRRGPAQVRNLEVAGPHSYVAGGFLAHNKGGGYGGGRGGRGGAPSWFTILVYGFVWLASSLMKRRDGRKQELDVLLPRASVEARAAACAEAMKALAKGDRVWEPEACKERAAEVFMAVQKAWMARDHQGMDRFMLKAILRDHESQVEAMRRGHEINLLSDLELRWMELVHVAAEGTQSSFTVLLEASARDHYVDDRTSAFLRGSHGSERFQECWTFHLDDGQWKLREIEQVDEAVSMEEPLRVPQSGLTAAPVPAGAHGGRLADKLEALSRRDPAWSPAALREAARSAFVAVVHAREARDPGEARELASGPLLEGLEKEASARLAGGEELQFRNLCVRSVSIVLARNRRGSDDDEFVARISAHAQRVLLRGGQVVAEQGYLEPWEEHWTFRRRGAAWVAVEAKGRLDGPEFSDEETGEKA